LILSRGEYRLRALLTRKEKGIIIDDEYIGGNYLQYIFVKYIVYIINSLSLTHTHTLSLFWGKCGHVEYQSVVAKRELLVCQRDLFSKYKRDLFVPLL